MKSPQNKKHWENVYQTKKLDGVSWYQPVPEASLTLVKNAKLGKNAFILDVGGGDSLLVDYLLDLGYTNISVLDISETAIEKAKKRLGTLKAKQVNWIVQDILDFSSDRKFDFWHDRATFHFLTDKKAIEKYTSIAQAAIKPNGVLSIGTFSNKGPTKCSGLPISQYNEASLTSLFKNGFQKTGCFFHLHTTPFNTQQSFIYCTFQKC